jgi:DUF4097 and DUF4098 domain-containing protein YvlB
MNPVLRSARVVLILAVACAAVAVPARAGFDENLSFAADSLVVRNLIGEVRVEGHSGSSFEIQVSVQGKDGTKENIRLEAKEGNNAELNILFPVDRQKSYVYPELGRGSSTNFDLDSDGSWLAKLFGSGRIRVKGSGSGMEVWADVTVRVPAGADFELKHGAGRAYGKDLDGDIELWVRSGHVEVERVDGKLLVDTGSGHVNVADVNGDLLVDTGSGHVEAENIVGERINIDTGSGHVELDTADGSSLLIDTGSGRVTASGIQTDSATIDTGSGSVTLELDRMGTGRFHIDTGSGSVRLKVPPGASADVRAETGSGGIELDLDEPVEIRYKDRDEISFKVGGGAADVVIDTGSGSIRISN